VENVDIENKYLEVYFSIDKAKKTDFFGNGGSK